MSNKYLVIALLFIGLMQSCTQNKVGKDISIQKQSFSRMDFAETKDLKSPEKIVLKDVLYPASFRVIKDSILVINNQPVCDYLIELYSLNTLQPILRIVPKGKGPEEMISCWLSLHTNNNHRFYLQDDKTKTYYTVDIDSIMKYRKLYVLSKFKYISEILSMADICVTDSNKYILCNYKVDRHIHSISVDKNEEYLYCVGNKSVREDSEFLRYEL